jgi:methylase of polypeptide subunit release factors
MESYYDIIVCNPPWIPSGVLNKDDPLEYSVYDEDATLLKNVLAFSSNLLNRISIKVGQLKPRIILQ